MTKVTIITKIEGQRVPVVIDVKDIHVSHLRTIPFSDLGTLLSTLPEVELKRLWGEINDAAREDLSKLNLLSHFPKGKDYGVRLPLTPIIRCPLCQEVSEVADPNVKTPNSNGVNGDDNDDIPYKCPKDHKFNIKRGSIIDWLKWID